MYQALYRKYRPSDFSHVVGQPQVTETLKGELSQGKIFHAYLFTGTRGTGKTSCAKILAKAVNCQNPVNGDPCGECESCKAIAAGEVMDIVEIDAASNNGVDDVRLLREQAVFTPASAKYRVYIIDEVHMLSKAAFNALLKTLEEPPAHVIFILATTEVQELPATILSRCQRFDFTRIDAEVIKKQLLFVAESENLELTPEGASLIAALSDGCMRDALSLLDLCAGAGEEITEKVVEKSCGMTGREHINEMVGFIASGDTAGILELAGRLYAASVDVKRLCSDLIAHFRDLMVIKSAGRGKNLVVCSDVQFETYEQQAAGFTAGDIMDCLNLLCSTLPRIKGAVARYELEMALIKLCNPDLRGEVAELKKRVAELEKGGAVRRDMPAAPRHTAPPAPAYKPAPAYTAPAAKEEIPLPDIPPIPDAPDLPPAAPEPLNAPAPAPAEKPVQGTPAAPAGEFSWQAVLAQLTRTAPLLYGMLAGSVAEIRDDKIAINTPNTGFWDMIKSDSGSRQKLSDALRAVSGRDYTPIKTDEVANSNTDPLADFGKRIQMLSHGGGQEN